MDEVGEVRERPIRVRWAGSCHRCSVFVPTRSMAWWDHKTKVLTCLSCVPDPSVPASPVATLAASSAVEALVEAAGAATDPSALADGTVPASVPVPVPAPEADGGGPGPLTDAERGTAGASARAERLRRSTKREERLRAKHPRIGGLLLAVSDDPTSTKVWDQGAVGEERVGARLDEARPRIEVLHDRRIPRSRANLDHLVVAPTGIWVVDTKRYLDRRIETRVVGRRRERQLHLFVGGRDRTGLVIAMHKQVAQVRDALIGSDHEHLAVRGALCFIGATVGFFARPFEIDGIVVTWPKHLIAPMLEVDPGREGADLSEVDRTRVARHLADAFRPA